MNKLSIRKYRKRKFSFNKKSLRKSLIISKKKKKHQEEESSIKFKVEKSNRVN